MVVTKCLKGDGSKRCSGCVRRSFSGQFYRISLGAILLSLRNFFKLVSKRFERGIIGAEADLIL